MQLWSWQLESLAFWGAHFLGIQSLKHPIGANNTLCCLSELHSSVNPLGDLLLSVVSLETWHCSPRSSHASVTSCCRPDDKGGTYGHAMLLRDADLEPGLRENVVSGYVRNKGRKGNAFIQSVCVCCSPILRTKLLVLPLNYYLEALRMRLFNVHSTQSQALLI